jgi:hypothetical protein
VLSSGSNITLAASPRLLDLALHNLHWDSDPQYCLGPHSSGQLQTDLQLRVQMCCKQKSYEGTSNLEAGGPHSLLYEVLTIGTEIIGHIFYQLTGLIIEEDFIKLWPP